MKRLIIPFISFLLLLMSNLAIAESNPSNVFQLSTGLLSPEGIQLNWKMTEGAYLYKKFIKVVSLDPTIQVGTPIFPEGQIKETQLFGTVTVYHDSLSLNIPIENPEHHSLIKLELSYQGCSEQGQCFPPVKEILNVNLNTQSATIESTSSILPTNKLSEVRPLNETESIEEKLKNSSLMWIFGGFFVLGLVLSVTPCVLPMIPILSSIILYGHKKNTNNIKAFSLSFAYVLGMSFAYASLGFLMSLVGSQIQTFFQNPYILIAFSLLFVLLAFSLLGFFEVRWSRITNNKLSQFNQRLAQIACKNHITVLFMGFLSALIVSPCITPPLVGALSYISTTDNYMVGSIALFCMGLGLGLPLLFIGALGNTFLPKAGQWMEAVKFLMGIILLGIAFFMLQRLVSHYVMILWSAFALITSIILLYRINFQTPWKRFLFQTICFVGIVGGGFNIIHHVFGHSTSQQQSYITVTNVTELNHSLALAKKEHKPVMLDFYADWCPDCQHMETQVFNQPDIQRLMKNFMWIKIDMTNDSQAIWAIQEQYNVTGPPTFLFYAADGTFLKQYTFVGTKSKTDVEKLLAQL